MKKSDQAIRSKYSAILRDREKDYNKPVAAYCKKHGISPSTYWRWKKLLRLPARRNPPRGNFIPLTVAQPSPPAVDSSRHSYDFRFPNGATLKISGTVDSAGLSEIIRSVGQIPS
jgi:hypothetical protein